MTQRFTLIDVGFIKDETTNKIMNPHDTVEMLNLLNEDNLELEQESKRIKQNIQDSLTNERTELGKSVLRQLLDQL